MLPSVRFRIVEKGPYAGQLGSRIQIRSLRPGAEGRVATPSGASAA
ncbi:hypothetical protein ACP70R_005720 [Stipagrostis hirtigluma subsp. patula]